MAFTRFHDDLGKNNEKTSETFFAFNIK